MNGIQKKPNILILITDQEREVMHWPEGWADANLPSRARLLANGLQFTNAQCNTAACSSSRATFFTSLYPAQHGIKNLVNTGNPSDIAQRRTPGLSSSLPNLAKVMAEAIAVLNLDNEPPEPALKEVKAHPQISSIGVVKLPPAGEMPAWFG